MKKYTILSLFIVLLFTVACEKTNMEDDILLNTEYTLEFDKTATIENTSIDIKFDELLEDSRCPTGVACIWEGRAWVKLIGTNSGTETDIELITENSMNLDSMVTANYLDYQIELINVDPYPDGNTTADNKYDVTFVVTEL